LTMPRCSSLGRYHSSGSRRAHSTSVVMLLGGRVVYSSCRPRRARLWWCGHAASPRAGWGARALAWLGCPPGRHPLAAGLALFAAAAARHRGVARPPAGRAGGRARHVPLAPSAHTARMRRMGSNAAGAEQSRPRSAHNGCPSSPGSRWTPGRGRGRLPGRRCPPPRPARTPRAVRVAPRARQARDACLPAGYTAPSIAGGLRRPPSAVRMGEQAWASPGGGLQRRHSRAWSASCTRYGLRHSGAHLAESPTAAGRAVAASRPQVRLVRQRHAEVPKQCSRDDPGKTWHRCKRSTRGGGCGTADARQRNENLERRPNGAGAGEGGFAWVVARAVQNFAGSRPRCAVRAVGSARAALLVSGQRLQGSGGNSNP
jgi:hypothetical protein